MKAPAHKRPLLHPKRFSVIVILLIVCVGFAGSFLSYLAVDTSSKDYLKGQAQAAADAIALNDLKSLKISENDVATLAYANTKGRLEQIRTRNPDLELAQLLAKKGDQIIVLADSEQFYANNHVAPGQTYFPATPTLLASFTSLDKPFTEGPSQYLFNTWISAYAPVTDPQTGRVEGIVGLKQPAKSYYTKILAYTLVPLLLAAIPLAGLIRDLKLAAKEQEIMQLKNQFVSIASHELRSPLNGMLWAIQSIMKDPQQKLAPDQSEMLHDMYRSAEASLATVNEILDFTIFDRGKGDRLQREQLDFKTVVSEVQKTLKLGAAEKDITLKVIGTWPEQVLVTGDVAALKRSMMNIVSNAIKYSPEHAEISIGYSKDASHHIIAVQDHGIGIPTNEQAKVLEGYYRATNATKSQANGTGLGLWLTRLIVEQHGGNVWLKSKELEGTIVYLALPFYSLAADVKKA